MIIDEISSFQPLIVPLFDLIAVVTPLSPGSVSSKNVNRFRIMMLVVLLTRCKAAGIGIGW